MQYTKEKRKRLAVAFTAAQKRLSPTHFDGNGISEFICIALENSGRLGDIPKADALLATTLITDRLQGEVVFTNWLVKFGGIAHEVVTKDRQNNQGRMAQITRRAWLDALIEEFSA